eukprot:1381248-Amphidinium_carterae.1
MGGFFDPVMRRFGVKEVLNLGKAFQWDLECLRCSLDRGDFGSIETRNDSSTMLALRRTSFN